MVRSPGQTKVTLTAAIPANLAASLGVGPGKAGDVLTLRPSDAVSLVTNDVAQFGAGPISPRVAGRVTQVTVTLLAAVPAVLAADLGLSGASTQTGAVLALSPQDARTLVQAGLARFGSAAQDAARHTTLGTSLANDPALRVAFDGATAGLVAALGNRPAKFGLVLDTGSPGDFDDGAVESLAPFFDPESGRLAATYTAYHNAGNGTIPSVGLAYSDDGITWKKAGLLFAGSGLAGSPDEVGCTGPVILLHEGTYWLFYIGTTQIGYEAGVKSLCLASSPSLAHPVWTRHGAALTPSGSGARASAIWHPNLVHDGDTFYLFVNTGDASGRETIGYATAASPAGPWTFHDGDGPLLQPGPGESICGDPAVTKIPGGWRMDYFTAASAGNTASDWYTTTSDASFPLGWTPHDPADLSRRTVTPGPDAYDASFAHKPVILRYAGRLLHYYTAVATNGHRAVALAADPPIPYAYASALIPEVDATRTTGATDGTVMEKSTLLFDATGKRRLEMRLVARVNPGPAATMAMWVNAVPDCRATVTGDGWQNVVGPWVPVAKAGLFDSYLMWNTSNGWNVQFGSGACEFRWIA